MIGTIVKAIAGFYYVQTAEKLYQCKARGIFKKDGITPYVGDNAAIEVTDILDDEGVINEILPRRNQFIRPPVANVDCFLVVMSLKKPEPNLHILDKFLVMAEAADTDIVICLNKADLAEEKEIGRICDIYQPLYHVICIFAVTGDGIEELRSVLPGKKSAFAGPSGVGKSSLVNRIQQDFGAETGAIGHKSGRGKHTTRHSELFSINTGGMIYDTPGFTSFDILDAEEDQLGYFYPEISERSRGCKYDDCRHTSEPGCAVLAALGKNEINRSRYDSYLMQLESIREKEKNRW